MRPISSWPNRAWVGTPKISVTGRARGCGGFERRLRAAQPAGYPSRRWATWAWPQQRAVTDILFLPLFHQRAVAILQRPERLVGRDRRADLVVVPRALRFRRLLDFDQVRRMDLAAVDADRALAEQRIVGRHFLHLGHDLGAVVALQRLDRLEVMQQ